VLPVPILGIFGESFSTLVKPQLEILLKYESRSISELAHSALRYLKDKGTK